jgi:hypothetical protein
MLPAEIFLLGILIFEGLTARRICESLGVKGLNLFSTVQRRTDRLINFKFNIIYWPHILKMLVDIFDNNTDINVSDICFCAY